MQNNFKGNRKNTTNTSADRPRNKTFDLGILKCAKNHAGNAYNHQGVVDMLNDMEEMNVFGCVSVPVWINKSDCSEDKERRGKLVIGYVKKINGDTVSCTIFGNYVKFVEGFSNPVVYLRGYVDQGTMLSVQAFEICDSSRYAEFVSDAE
jgi:hypothetical protein